jgi:hypothetical protein
MQFIKKLIEDWKHNHLVQIHLVVILPALTKLAKHIFKDLVEIGVMLTNQ